MLVQASSGSQFPATMKQVPITDMIRQRLSTAGADPAKVVVFESVALNTKPIRKQHPLYKGAVHSRAMLQEMADALNNESLPLQAMHDSGVLPFGRAFYGEVFDVAGGSELRALFWVDKQHPDVVDLIDSGTVDQVSVSVLAAEALCSACDYNFLAKDASVENIWSGTCPDNHVMGLNGIHAKMTKLNQWFELSLVGKGGASGAKISGPAESRLAADGNSTHPFALNLVADPIKPESSMSTIDPNKLIQDLSESRAAHIVLTADKNRLEASVAEKDEKITALTASIAAKDAKIAELEAAKPAAGATELAALKDVAKHLLTLAGRVTDAVPEEVGKIVELVKGMKLSIAGSSTTPADSGKDAVALRATGAFTTRK